MGKRKERYYKKKVGAHLRKLKLKSEETQPPGPPKNPEPPEHCYSKDPIATDPQDESDVVKKTPQPVPSTSQSQFNQAQSFCIQTQPPESPEPPEQCYSIVPMATDARDAQVRSVIAKVYHYLEQEYEELKCLYPHVELSPLGCVSRRAALATGVTELTVLEVLKEEADRLAAADQPPAKRTRTSKKRSSDNHDKNGNSNNIDDRDKPAQDMLVITTKEDQGVHIRILPMSAPNPVQDFEMETLVIKEEPEDHTDYTYSKTVADNVSSDDVVRRDKRRAAAELAGHSSTQLEPEVYVAALPTSELNPLMDFDEANIVVKKEQEDITCYPVTLIPTEVKQEDTDNEGIS